MDKLLATLEQGKCKAEIYETALPGQFCVRYYDSAGTMVNEDELTGISTYKQREDEIMQRLQTLCVGEAVKSGQLSDPGEY